MFANVCDVGLCVAYAECYGSWPMHRKLRVKWVMLKKLIYFWC